jgi:hypothetical protein
MVNNVTFLGPTPSWSFGDIAWSMSKTYFKKGQSAKIASQTCKPELNMLDANGIKALTDGLAAHFGAISMESVGPVQTTTTY